MSLRPYIAAFLIAAIVNPFCCCFSKPIKGERTSAAVCPHCPQPTHPAEDQPEKPCDCTSAKKFTDSEDVVKIPVANARPVLAGDWGEIAEPYPARSDRAASPATVAADLSGGPPLRVRFCTYSL